MGRVFLILLVLAAIWWGITSTFFKIYTDPFGMTTREEVRSQTAIETTRLEMQAAVGIAQTQAQAAVEIASTQAYAQIESTRLLADAAIEQAREERKQTEAWTDVLPLLLLIVASGGAVWLLIMYQGRLLLLLVGQGKTLPYWSSSDWENKAQPETSTPDNLDDDSEFDPEEALRRYAANHNLAVRQENGYYLLVHKRTQHVVKQLVLRS
jgi:hypothetical protein